MPTCAVLGGHGFVGRHVIDALVARGDYVVRIVDLCCAPDAHARWLSTGCESRLADINRPDELALAIRGCEVVLHLAGIVDTRSGTLHDDRIMRINFEGTANVIAACRTCLLYTSPSPRDS